MICNKSMSARADKTSYFKRLMIDLSKNKILYLMVLPTIIFYFVFAYVPMYGVLIAFKDFNASLGILKSPWAGLKHFKDFFESVYFGRVMTNTIRISLTNLLFGFPAPIIFALVLNEIRSKRAVKTIQTFSYIPHFISLVVICGMIKQFTNDNGFINDIIEFFGGERVSMLNQPSYFVPLYVISGIWQDMGWTSIIYVSALLSIDNSLYEAATIDGAGRFRQIIHVSLPGIMPTIITMLLMQVGNILNVGYEKIILMYNPATYKTADVISTFVYRKGLLEFNLSFSTAVGLFNSVINFCILVLANKVTKRVVGTSLW